MYQIIVTKQRCRTKTATVARSLLFSAALVALIPSAILADRGDDQFAVAANHYQQRRWELAAQEFQSLLADHPVHRRTADAVFFLGESLMQLSRHADAHKQFDRLLNDHPAHRFRRQATFRRGEAAHFSDDDQTARRDLAEFLDRFGADPLAGYAGPYLAERHFAAGEIADAFRRYDNAIKLFPEGPLFADCRFARAECWQKLGQLDKAAEAFAEIAAANDGRFSARAGFQHGMIQYSQGDYAAAESSLRAVQQQNTIDGNQENELTVSIDYWIGMSLKGQQKWKAAAELLAPAVERVAAGKRRATIGYHAGDAWLRAEEIEKAAAILALVAADAADTEWADDIALANIHIAVARDDTATVKQLADQFKTTLADSLLRADALRVAAAYLLQQGQAADAADHLQQLANGNPTTDGDPIRDEPLTNKLRQPTTARDDLTLAIALQRAGRPDEALAQLAKVVARDQGDVRLQAWLTQGAILVDRGEYREAIGPLSRYLGAAPDAEQAWACREQLTICYAASNQIEAARGEYDLLTAAAMNPRPEVTFTLAEAALRQKDYVWSTTLFEQLAEAPLPPGAQARALAGLGWGQFYQGRFLGSAQTFDRLLKRFPDAPQAPEAAFTRGQALEKINKIEPALEMYLLIIDKHQNSPQIEQSLLRAARVSDLLDHNESAIKLYDRLLREFKTSEFHDDALYQSAWVTLEEEQRDEAQARFLRLHQDHRNSRYWPDATYRLATDAHRAGRHDDSRRLIDDLLASDPPSPILEHALYLRGQIAAATDNWEQAVKPLDQLLAAFPTSRLALAAEYWRAEVDYQQERFEKASKRFETLAGKIERADGSWPAMVPLRRAQIRAHAKNWQEAAEIASTIEQAYPRFGQLYEVHYLLGRCHFAAAKFDEARAAFGESIAATGGRKLETAAMAQWMIGESYFHQKKYETAIREYYRVEALYDFARWQCGALLQAGKCYEHLGRFREAVAAYDRIVNDYPETNFTAEATRRRVVARQRAELAQQPRTTQEF